MGNVCCTNDKDLTRGGRVKVSKLPNKGDLDFNDDLDQNDLFNKRRTTYAPNMKNFKNLKQVQNIYDVYDFKESLGKGSYGLVKKAIRAGSKNAVAVKIIEKASLS